MIIRNSILKIARKFVGDAPVTIFSQNSIQLSGGGYFFWLGYDSFSKPFAFELEHLPPDVFLSEFVRTMLVDENTMRFEDNTSRLSIQGKMVEIPQRSDFIMSEILPGDHHSRIEAKYLDKIAALIKEFPAKRITETANSIYLDDGRVGIMKCN